MSGKYLGSDGYIHYVTNMGSGQYKVCCASPELDSGILCYWSTLATLQKMLKQGRLKEYGD